MKSLSDINIKSNLSDLLLEKLKISSKSKFNEIVRDVATALTEFSTKDLKEIERCAINLEEPIKPYAMSNLCYNRYYGSKPKRNPTVIYLYYISNYKKYNIFDQPVIIISMEPDKTFIVYIRTESWMISKSDKLTTIKACFEFITDIYKEQNLNFNEVNEKLKINSKIKIDQEVSAPKNVYTDEYCKWLKEEYGFRHNEITIFKHTLFKYLDMFKDEFTLFNYNWESQIGSVKDPAVDEYLDNFKTMRKQAKVLLATKYYYIYIYTCLGKNFGMRYHVITISDNHFDIKETYVVDFIL